MKGIGTNQHIPNWFLCTESSKSKLMTYQRRGWILRFQSNSTRLKKAVNKSLEKISGMILNWWQPKFAAKSWICCKWNVMFKSSIENSIDWTSFNFLFKDFLSNLLTQFRTSKMCPKFQVLSSHFSMVRKQLSSAHWKLLDEQWKKMCKEKIF